MAEKFDAAGLPTELTAVDYLAHRGEQNPRTRSGVMAVDVLDSVPDWDRFLSSWDNASRRVLRLRQKVVVPLLPTSAPRWVVDPDFNLQFHVRRVTVPQPGTMRELFDLAEILMQTPLDITRPLWTVTLVDGLAEGRAAMLMHVSHAISDGAGAMEMFAQIYDLERDPPVRPAAPLPIPEELSPNDLTRDGLEELPRLLLARARALLGTAARATEYAVREPVSTIGDIVDYARSGRRVLQLPTEPSPLLRRRSLSTRSEVIEVELKSMRAAAKAVGASVNDIYLAGLCGALRLYHGEFGVPVAALPMGVPINLRTDDDPAGGNRIGGVMLAAPVGIADPVARVAEIRAQMRNGREEPALNVVGALAPVLSILPTALLDSLAQSVFTSDIQASNVPGYPGDTFIAGTGVLRSYGLGPLPGVAVMAGLMSRSGICAISTRYDRAAITDESLWARCLLAGFDEVLALGGPHTSRTVPVTFSESAPPHPAPKEGTR